MMFQFSSDRFIGILLCLAALSALFVWIPLDTETGMVEAVRRRLVVGDALAPSVAAALCLVFALYMAIWSRQTLPKLETRAFLSILTYIAVILAALLLMRLVGPVSIEFVNLLSSETLSYRALRANVPVKYLGFVAGGTVLISALSIYVDSRLSWRRIGMSFLIALFLALLFDLPFEDIILPPNGDV